MSLVLDQCLLQTAVSINDIHKIIHDTVLKSQDHIQVPKTDICIDNNCPLVQHCQTCANIGSCRCLAYATLTGCNYYHFAHVSVSSSRICSRLLVFSSVISDTGQMPCVC